MSFHSLLINTPAGFSKYPPLVCRIPLEGFLKLTQYTECKPLYLQVLRARKSCPSFYLAKS